MPGKPSVSVKSLSSTLTHGDINEIVDHFELKTDQGDFESHAGAGGAAHADAIAGGASGFMSGSDKTKLNGVATEANNYVHPNHSGDVTSAADGAQTIAANAVTNAKAAQMATKTYKGRTTAATGNAEDVPVATLKADLTLVKADVGLGSVDNTADSAKEVSGPQAAAIALKSTLTTTMGVVVHGAVAGTARPTGYTSVTWIGSVDPTNAINGDIWYSTVDASEGYQNLLRWSEEVRSTESGGVWESSNILIDLSENTDSLGGDSAIRLNVTSSGSHYMRQSVAVSPNTTYKFSFGSRGATTNSATARLAVVQGYNTDPNTIIQTETLNYHSLLNTTTFSRVEMTFTTGASVNNVWVNLLRNSGSNGFTFFEFIQLALPEKEYIKTEGTNVP
jgi:hypothetical protein